MYLHLGQDVVVAEANIVGIFDIENTTESGITRDFLRHAENCGSIYSVSDDLPKSFIVCNEGSDCNNGVFLSQLSTKTLLKRSGTMRFD